MALQTSYSFIASSAYDKMNASFPLKNGFSCTKFLLQKKNP